MSTFWACKTRKKINPMDELEKIEKKVSMIKRDPIVAVKDVV